MTSLARRFRLPIALAATALAVTVGILAWSWTDRASSSNLDRGFVPFAADIEFRGPFSAEGRIVYLGPGEWMYEARGDQITMRQTFVDGMHYGTMIEGGWSHTTASGVDTHLVPERWFANFETVTTYWGEPDGEHAAALRDDSPCTPDLGLKCPESGVWHTEERWEYDPETGILLRYMTAVDGTVSREIRFVNVTYEDLPESIEPPSEVDFRSDLLPPAETRVADPPAESS